MQNKDRLNKNKRNVANGNNINRVQKLKIIIAMPFRLKIFEEVLLTS